MRIFEYESAIAAPAKTVFDFHKRPDALQLLIPPGQPIRVMEHTGGIENGARVELRIGYWPFAIRWIARHQGYEEGRRFQDLQAHGPFQYWLHTHTVVPVTEGSSVLRDRIEYALRFGWLIDGALRRRLRATFAYRHKITAQYTASSKD